MSRARILYEHSEHGQMQTTARYPYLQYSTNAWLASAIQSGRNAVHYTTWPADECAIKFRNAFSIRCCCFALYFILSLTKLIG